MKTRSAHTRERKKHSIENDSTVEVSTADWADAEKIVTKYAFQAMMGEMAAKDAVSKMHKELLDANLIDK
ncbi:hypothetical protein [Bacillus sp. T33-2]|uniref:hypothetical protein n=1 Tax=Bacillus sp. T33-2 TaxID=2054168 RepID=UPI002155686A|nr:hypothetical protein [Bacillus sp. T33-2]